MIFHLYQKVIKWKIVSVILALILIITSSASWFYAALPERAIYEIPDGYTRIMSFNIRCGEYDARAKIVPQLIGEYFPDSVGVQECTYAWMCTLKLLLPEYQFVGVGRDNGTQNANCGEISGILYRKDKYKLVDSGTFWLSETPDEVSRGWDGACNRVCTWVVLERISDSQRYAHVNTHLDHMGPQARTNGLSLVTQKALSFDIPTVLTGDFNFKEKTDLYNQLVSSGMRDTKYIAEETMESFTFHGYAEETITHNLPIDYICVNSLIDDVKTYKVIKDKIYGKYVSDHYPIISDLVI